VAGRIAVAVVVVDVVVAFVIAVAVIAVMYSPPLQSMFKDPHTATVRESPAKSGGE
jgi:hypothetical protein